MKTYLGVKFIAAIAMTRGEYSSYRGWTLPKDEDAADEGFIVEYLDGGKPNVSGHTGYVSWSPKEQFDRAYRETNGLSFGLAIEAMRGGEKVARAGWNGKGMFLLFVDDWEPCGHAGQTIRDHKLVQRDRAPFIAMVTVHSDLVPWLASQTDMLADDWTIVQ